MTDASRAEWPALQSPPPPIEQPIAVVALVIAALAIGDVHRRWSLIASVHLVGRTVRPTIPPPRLMAATT